MITGVHSRTARTESYPDSMETHQPTPSTPSLSWKERLPSFIDPVHFSLFMRTFDGAITIDRIEPVEGEEDRSFIVFFKDRQQSKAGILFQEYIGEKDALECRTSFEMFIQGKGYGFELFIQLVRYNKFNPNVASQVIRATDRGRSVWTKFDGFELTQETIERVKKILTPHYSFEATPRMSPRDLAALSLDEPDLRLLPLAKRTHANRPEIEQLEATRFPGKLALMRLQKWDARLDLTGQTDAFERFERSNRMEWERRGASHLHRKTEGVRPPINSRARLVGSLWRSQFASK